MWIENTIKYIEKKNQLIIVIHIHQREVMFTKCQKNRRDKNE